MAKLSLAGIRHRLLRVFAVERRWLGYYTMAAHDLMAGVHPAGSPMAEVVDDLYERGRLLGVYNTKPACQYWEYLWTELLPSPEQLAKRCPPKRGGLLQCHVRVWN